VLPCRLDCRTSTTSNFHIEASHVRTKRMVVRTVDLMHAISISDTCATGPWWLASRRLDFECDTCLMDLACSDGNLRRTNGCSNLPIFVFWKEILKLGRTLSDVRTGYWNLRTDANWSSSKLLDTKEGPNRKFSSSGLMKLWTAGRLDGMTRHLDSW
jgi:hypothetical protein